MLFDASVVLLFDFIAARDEALVKVSFPKFGIFLFLVVGIREVGAREVGARENIIGQIRMQNDFMTRCKKKLEKDYSRISLLDLMI